MKNCKSFRPIQIAVIASYATFLNYSEAVVSIDVLDITSTSASISISGTVDPGFTPGTEESDTVFLGSAAPFDDWMLSDASLVSEQNLAGATSNLNYTNTSGFNPSDFGSDWFRFDASAPWSGGESISYVASFIGSFDVSALPGELLLVQGYENIASVIETGAVAGSGAVPEPSSAAFLLGAGALALASLRRRV